MRSRRVAKGRAARDRRYEAAVRRQVALVRHARTVGGQAAYALYADPEEFLRRGDTLDRFGWDRTPVITPAAAMACFDCGLPDNYRGQGDGIGSCDCHGCDRCAGRPGDCVCDHYDDPYECYDDEWDPPAVETVTAFAEAGLL